jgi:hypothetical protein
VLLLNVEAFKQWQDIDVSAIFNNGIDCINEKMPDELNHPA